MTATVALRPARDDDREFLFEVYASTRIDEFAAVPWTTEQRLAFLRQQFHAQVSGYRSQFPHADDFVITVDGAPAGRLCLARVDETEMRLVDVALLPGHRGRGVGTTVLHEIATDADRDGTLVSLHVVHGSPAIGLYARLGFERVAADDVYILMQRPPRRVS